MHSDSNDSLIRITEVIELIPVGKSTWWAGCSSGRYPKPIKLGPGVTVWRMSDIRALIVNGVASS
jgi:prophage regulatory protein